MSRPRVELLYLAGCPHWQAARELIIETSRALAIESDLHLIEITNQQDAHRLRFPGSPTVRIDGHDIEPGADVEPALSCRLYQTEQGTSGRPDRGCSGLPFVQAVPDTNHGRPRSKWVALLLRWPDLTEAIDRQPKPARKLSNGHASRSLRSTKLDGDAHAFSSTAH